MDSNPEEVMGCFLGMAVGDAMGRAVKGLKPEAIRQIFGTIEDYKDVRNIIGKGTRNYRIQGLYGAPTQCALAVCDGILKNKKKFIEETVNNFKNLSNGGPENYFGAFRSSESHLWKAVNLLDDRLLTEPTLLSSATGSFTSLSVPLALFYKNWSKTLASQCFQLTMVFSSHPLEIVGSVLNGFLVTRFLSVEGSTLVQKRKEILKEAVEVCIQAEMEYESSFKLFENEWMVKSKNAFSHTLQGLINQIEKPEKEVLQWIVENSNVYSNREIRYASQGFVLSLLLLALYWILNRESDFSLSSILRQGRETEKLGALVGAWTGALQGAQAIPENLKTGLVNGREISLRGDALFHRRMKKNAKVLVDMEMALTNKETEEGKRYLPKETRKVLKSINIDSWEDDEDIVPTKEDRAQWRKFQKEKTKAKRDRRKNLPSDFF
ncbi:MAG: ADP-ribosylglycohydrolase family protein [Nitrospinaceae bacterium]|nr:ADP-ribosylglycohydrolase family protein [Nitrospinaceae bacterium]